MRNQQNRVFVRAYADDVGKIADQDEARLVIAYVASLLESGWSPLQYKGTPGELVVPRQSAPPSVKRPWWRLW